MFLKNKDRERDCSSNVDGHWFNAHDHYHKGHFLVGQGIREEKAFVQCMVCFIERCDQMKKIKHLEDAI